MLLHGARRLPPRAHAFEIGELSMAKKPGAPPRGPPSDLPTPAGPRPALRQVAPSERVQWPWGSPFLKPQDRLQALLPLGKLLQPPPLPESPPPPRPSPRGHPPPSYLTMQHLVARFPGAFVSLGLFPYLGAKRNRERRKGARDWRLVVVVVVVPPALPARGGRVTARASSGQLGHPHPAVTGKRRTLPPARVIDGSKAVRLSCPLLRHCDARPLAAR